MEQQHYPRQPIFSTGMTGRCPRCGEGKVFDGYLTTAPECPHCGLDLGFADSADGPAVFVIFIVGFIVVGLAIAVEFAFKPAYWVHIALWVPLILGLSLGLLRPLKGLMIASQYVNRAREGRVDESTQ